MEPPADHLSYGLGYFSQMAQANSMLSGSAPGSGKT